jgi:hypothetical protein
MKQASIQRRSHEARSLDMGVMDEEKLTVKSSQKKTTLVFTGVVFCLSRY